jgi:hypothetical protein
MNWQQKPYVRPKSRGILVKMMLLLTAGTRTELAQAFKMMVLYAGTNKCITLTQNMHSGG